MNIIIEKSNGKRKLECDDAKVIELYIKAKKQLTETEQEYEDAMARNDEQTISFLSMYLVNIKEVKIALENEIKYRELEWCIKETI